MLHAAASTGADMRTHQEIDRRSLALHRLVAEKMRRDPALFASAKATLARWRTIVDFHSQPYLDEWERLFERGMEASLTGAVEDSQHAAALRQCSPLSCVLTSKERFAFLNSWNRDHETQGA